MSNKLKQIDLLNRDSLIRLAKKLYITGYTNNFRNPYRNKDYLKNEIITSLKQLKNRPQSVSDLSINKQTISSTSHTQFPSTALKRSKSCSSITHTKPYTHTYNTLPNTKTSCFFPPKKKIVAIGDIHGDLSVAIKALKLANVISHSIPDDSSNIKDIKWTGGGTFVVQLGDQIDRVRPSKLFNNLCGETETELYEDEGSDLKIISLFTNLNKQAQQVGGAVLSVFGNHELMNVDGDFRYVSPNEFREFGNYFNGKFIPNSIEPFGFKERKLAFQPGGCIARLLANNYYSIVQVGSWIFVHGGISPQCAEQFTLEEMNIFIQKWLLGDTSPETIQKVQQLYHTDDDDHSPFWSRIYSDMDEWNETESIRNFVKTMNMINVKNIKHNDNKVKGIVMGHSPQFLYGKGINSSANNRIWRADVGASRAFGIIEKNDECRHRLVQILVIEDDTKFSIVKEKCSLF